MRFLFVVIALLMCLSAQARDSKSIREFKREVPCPATGKRRGACFGYVVDHVVPLCAGGPDKLSNMQWQTIVDAKAKDREEARQCREARRHQ